MSYEDEIAAYEGSRTRIAALALELDAEQLAVTVPCCPRWTVKDVVGHLTGLLEDRTTGALPSDGFEGWTERQVVRHRDESIAGVVGTWRGLELEPSDAPPQPPTLAFDAVTHEHDVFQALGIPGDRHTESVRVGARRAIERMDALLGDEGPRVVLHTEDGERAVGGTGEQVGLTTTRFELLRLVTGRMSDREARTLAWDGDPAPVLHALFEDGFFTLQPADVLELDR